MTGWRTRIYHASRQPKRLKRAAVIMVACAFVLSGLITLAQPKESTFVELDPVQIHLGNEWRALAKGQEALPRDFTHWLRQFVASLPLLTELQEEAFPTFEGFQSTGKLLGYEVKKALQRHLPQPAAQAIVETYLEAVLTKNEAQIEAAKQRLISQSQAEKPVAYVHELLASLCLLRKEDAQALHHLLREAEAYPEARQVRENAVRLALRLKSVPEVQQMVAAGWVEPLEGFLKFEAGSLIEDLSLQWRGLLAYRLENLPWLPLLLTFLAAALWFTLLVLHLPAHAFRWVWPVAPLMAGVFSVWPTLSILSWQEGPDFNPELWSDFPWDLWHLIQGVAFREEFCKLALAALFMPWLLHRRAPAGALVCGAFVGLGFAMEENLDYFQDQGLEVAVGRFLSANFMHLALTGLTTQALYLMLRTRFAKAGEFISTFALAMLAHAIYDYQNPALGGLETYLPFITLALVSWQFWDQLSAEIPYPKQTLSPAALFLLGTAFLISLSLLAVAISTGSWDSVLDAAIASSTMLPVVILYWRQFEPAGYSCTPFSRS